MSVEEKGKEFQKDYMDGKGSCYNGNDVIDHSLFRVFVEYLYSGLANDMKEIMTQENLGMGLQDANSITLEKNEPQAYTLPSNAMLFAIEVRGVGTVQLGNSQSTLGDLGEITSTGDTAILQVGLVAVEEIWLQSDADVEIVPIIYKR